MYCADFVIPFAVYDNVTFLVAVLSAPKSDACNLVVACALVASSVTIVASGVTASFLPEPYTLFIVAPVKSRASPYLYDVWFDVGAVTSTPVITSFTVTSNVAVLPLYVTVNVWVPTVLAVYPVTDTDASVISIAVPIAPDLYTGITFPPVKFKVSP